MSDDGKNYTSDDESGQQVIYERPTGWRGVYSHPYTQVSMLGFVCFMGPGLFNALTGLGAGGRVDSHTASTANAALYAMFAFAAFFAGTINNKLGSRWTLLLGTTGYSIYIASFLASLQHTNANGFTIAAGVILGICAGLLWTAQGSMMLSYATEQQKGRFIAIFWGIFNLGGVVGSAVAFGQNFHNESGAVGQGTYIGFLVLTLIGVSLPLLMVPAEKMIRMDGTKVTAPRHPTWQVEFKSLFIALITDPMIILLFPMFFASNWFYTWQFNAYNGFLFNIRTRSLNGFLYWTSQIFGSLAIGLLLDQKKLTRRMRAWAGWAVLFAAVMMIHIWAYQYAKKYDRDTVVDPIDLSDSRYPSRVWLYIFFGIVDAMWQTTAYWLMGAMSNDPAKLAHFTGFYKSIQSAGGAVAWASDSAKAPYINLFISTWVLLVGGLLFMLPMMYLRVKNTTELSEEVLARMDDDGHIRAAEEMAPAHAVAPSEKK